MYGRVLYVFALFTLFLNIKVRGDDLSHVHDFCLNYLGKEKSDTKISSDEQDQDKTSQKCTVLEETVASIVKKMTSLEKTVAMMKEKYDYDTAPVCGVELKGNVSYSSNPIQSKPYFGQEENPFWSPAKDDKEPWIQIELYAPTEIWQIGTVRYSDNGCVEAFTISHGNSTDNLQQIKGKDGKKIVFSGVDILDKEFKQEIPFPVACQYIRLYPEIWCRDKITYFKVYPAICSHE